MGATKKQTTTGSDPDCVLVLTLTQAKHMQWLVTNARVHLDLKTDARLVKKVDEAVTRGEAEKAKRDAKNSRRGPR